MTASSLLLLPKYNKTSWQLNQSDWLWSSLWVIATDIKRVKWILLKPWKAACMATHFKSTLWHITKKTRLDYSSSHVNNVLDISSWSHFSVFSHVNLIRSTIYFRVVVKIISSYREVMSWNNVKLLQRFWILFSSIRTKLRSLRCISIQTFSKREFSVLLFQNSEPPTSKLFIKIILAESIETVNKYIPPALINR